MNSYRVAFEDSHNGQTFGFAIIYKAKGMGVARVMAAVEFPNCDIKEVRLLDKED